MASCRFPETLLGPLTAPSGILRFAVEVLPEAFLEKKDLNMNFCTIRRTDLSFLGQLGMWDTC
jgi:hypothetical protein